MSEAAADRPSGRASWPPRLLTAGAALLLFSGVSLSSSETAPSPPVPSLSIAAAPRSRRAEAHAGRPRTEPPTDDLRGSREEVVLGRLERARGEVLAALTEVEGLLREPAADVPARELDAARAALAACAAEAPSPRDVQQAEAQIAVLEAEAARWRTVARPEHSARVDAEARLARARERLAELEGARSRADATRHVAHLLDEVAAALECSAATRAAALARVSALSRVQRREAPTLPAPSVSTSASRGARTAAATGAERRGARRVELRDLERGRPLWLMLALGALVAGGGLAAAHLRDRGRLAPQESASGEPAPGYDVPGLLWGKLDGFPLADVLQSLEFQHRTGTLWVWEEHRTGRVLLRGGCPVAAQYEERADDAAVRAMLGLRRARFAFREEPVALTGNRLSTITKLMLESSRSHDVVARADRLARLLDAEQRQPT